MGVKIDFNGILDEWLADHPFRIIDIGARDGCKTVFKPLQSCIRLLAFEPDENEFQRLSNQALDESGGIRFIQSAVYSSPKVLNLHLTRSPYFSSVFPPNDAFLGRFAGANTDGYRWDRTAQVEANTLDALAPSGPDGRFDWIKIDAEGCAYEILTGAQRILSENLVMGIYVEAEFNPKYLGQKLQSEVDVLLRKHGYELLDFKVCRWKKKSGLKTGGVDGQPVHGCFLYTLEPDVFFGRLCELETGEARSKILKAIVFCSLYGVYDAAYEVLDRTERERMLDAKIVAHLRRSLSGTGTFFARIPKLQNRPGLGELFYHAFMLCGGAWLHRRGAWTPQVRL